MNKFNIFYGILFSAALSMAQEHGHSHGVGGEAEHSYPVFLVLAVVAVVGAGLFFFGKKK